MRRCHAADGASKTLGRTVWRQVNYKTVIETDMNF